MRKRLMKDVWFQMFAAVGGLACVVALLGGVTARHVPTPAPAAAVPAAAAPPTGAKAAALAEPAAPVAAVEGPITPSAPPSTDLAAYRSPGALIAPPASAPPPPQAAPQITLSGTGVGNTAGIVGSAGGGAGGLFSSLLGPTALTAARALPAQPPLFRIAPSKPGVFTVGPPGTPGVDTSSLRDAVYSASNGDLILVKPGTYEGPVEIRSKTVRIRGTGGYPAAVIVRWTGPGATISVRGGSLDLEKIRLERGAYHELHKAEPGGALYASASALTMRKVELDSGDFSAPPLIVEEGGKPARVEAEDSRISTIGAGALIRGAVKATFTRMTFHATKRPLAAWIDAAVSLRDCVFLDTGEPSVIHAYEGARVTLSGKQKPYVSGVRGSEATAFEDSFGGGRPAASGGFARDIFRRGRRPGTFP